VFCIKQFVKIRIVNALAIQLRIVTEQGQKIETVLSWYWTTLSTTTTGWTAVKTRKFHYLVVLELITITTITTITII